MKIGPVKHCDPNYFNDAPRHRKTSKKSPPKKAGHKHEYTENVLLRYFNRMATFLPERGFRGQVDWYAGSRCTICGKLRTGFADGSCPCVTGDVLLPWGDHELRRKVLKPEYSGIPEVHVNNIFDLKEEKNG